MLEIVINQGDEFIMDLSVSDTDGNLVDLSDQEFIFAGKYNPITDSNLAFEGTVTVVDGTTLHCVIDAETTGKLKNAKHYGEYSDVYWDIYDKTSKTRILSGVGKISTGIAYRGIK